MNKKFLKRIVAFAMAATMVFGSSAIAFAAEDDNLTGQGTYEGVVNDAEYLTIELPTAAENQFDFVADPNELISKFASEAAGFIMPTGTDTGVYFATPSATQAGKIELSNDSASLKVLNKNYLDSDISVEVAVKTAGTNSPAFTSRSAWAAGVTAKELYMAVVGEGDNVSETDYIKEDGKAAKISFTVSGSPANYTTKFVSESAEGAAWGQKRGYFVTAVSAAVYDDDSKWVSGGFHLTGAINKNTGVDWGKGFTMPELKVTWTIGKHAGGKFASTSISASSSEVGLTLPDGVTISSVTLNKSDGGTTALTKAKSQWNFVNGKFSVATAVLSAHVGETITVAFSDSTSETLTIS